MHPSAKQDLTTLVAGSMRFEWCLAVTLYLETQLTAAMFIVIRRGMCVRSAVGSGYAILRQSNPARVRQTDA